MGRKNKFQELARRNLSNNFIGEKNMSATANLAAAISNKFGVTITNEANVPITVAILPAHYRTLGIASGVQHYHNITEMNGAGALVNAVIDEGTWTMTGANDTTIGTIRVNSTTPTRTVGNFLEYIKHYPQMLAKLLISSKNTDAFTNSIDVSYVNPFNSAERRPIDMNQYFSLAQYQDTRIDLSFDGVDFPFTPDLLMTIVIPANTTVTLDMFFR